MVDIPSTAPTPPTPQQAQSATNVTPVPVTTTDLPNRIQQLLQQIQVPATVSNVSSDGTSITLDSIIGKLMVSMQATVDTKQQQMVQQLINLLQTQKQVTVVVQPGSPPTQAYLLIPQPAPSAGTASAQTATNIAQTNILLQSLPPRPQAQPVSAGTTFTAIVLPQGIVIPQSSPQQTQSPPVVSPPYTPAGTLPTATPPISVPSLPVPSALQNLPAISIPNLTPDILNIIEETALIAVSKAEAAVAQTQQQILNTVPNAPPQTSSPVPTPASAASVTPVPFSVTAPALQQSAVVITPQPSPLPIQTTATPPTLTSLLQPGTQISLRVDAVYIPPAFTQSKSPALPLSLIPAPVPASLPTPGPNQVVATVTGNGPDGQLILQSGDTTLYVKQSVNAPVGSSVLLTVSQAKPDLPVTLPSIQSFSSLPQLIAALTQIDPQLAQTVITNHIPQPTPALPGALLFFMSAFKQGNVRTWLGDDAVNTLMRFGKFDVINKLTQELNAASQPAHDNVVGEWKSYPIPLQTNNQFQTLNLYVHQQGDRQGGKEASGKAGKNNVRFLIDVRMSRLGALQLDGFVQPKKLDMIVRSEQTLPEGMHQDLRNAYIKALGAVDYAGSLNFQVGRHHWLNLQKPANPATITT